MAHFRFGTVKQRRQDGRSSPSYGHEGMLAFVMLSSANLHLQEAADSLSRPDEKHLQGLRPRTIAPKVLIGTLALGRPDRC